MRTRVRLHYFNYGRKYMFSVEAFEEHRHMSPYLPPNTPDSYWEWRTIGDAYNSREEAEQQAAHIAGYIYQPPETVAEFGTGGPV